MEDLFDTPELIPENVTAILESFNEETDAYSELNRVNNELIKIGYSFDWYLDAQPYNLHKIE